MARGGKRTPRNPAPVSTPSSGARTDGGPGDRNAWRVPSGQDYGARQNLEAVQSVAPAASAGTPGGPGGAVAPAGPSLPDPFGPSQRPNEPGDFGLAGPDQQLSAADTLKIIYSKRPSPWIAGLLNDIP